MPRPPGQEPPDQRVHRLLIAHDQIAPRLLLAALGTADRQLVEGLGRGELGGKHLLTGITRVEVKGSMKSG